MGVETTVGKVVIRGLGKRKSVNTPMFGEFHGHDSQPVLRNISNPVINQAKSKKPRQSVAESSQHSGAADVPSMSASKAPVPSNAQGGAADVLSADALPSSGADDDSSSSASDEDDNDVTRLLFGNNVFDGTQDDDAPVTETLQDPDDDASSSTSVDSEHPTS